MAPIRHRPSSSHTTVRPGGLFVRVIVTGFLAPVYVARAPLCAPIPQDVPTGWRKGKIRNGNRTGDRERKTGKREQEREGRKEEKRNPVPSRFEVPLIDHPSTSAAFRVQVNIERSRRINCLRDLPGYPPWAEI